MQESNIVFRVYKSWLDVSNIQSDTICVTLSIKSIIIKTSSKTNSFLSGSNLYFETRISDKITLLKINNYLKKSPLSATAELSKPEQRARAELL